MLLSIIIAFTLKLALSFLPSFTVDMSAWLGWAVRLSQTGPASFYSQSIWTQYTPGFLYWLWLGGKIGWVNQLLVKLPTIVADIFTGLLIYKIIKRRHHRLGHYCFFFYVLSPAIIFISSVWGQIDGILTAFLVSAFYFSIEKKQPYLSWLFWAIAFLIKPQAIALFPALAIVSLRLFTLKQHFFSVLIAMATIVFGSLPFFPNSPIFGLPNLISSMGQDYQFTSLFAFNTWSIIPGMWKSDAATFLNLSYYHWGIILYLLSLGTLFIQSFRWFKNSQNFYLLASLSSLSFFLFPTRIHERYLFPFFAFFLIFAALKKSTKLLYVYVFASFAYLINIYLPYAYYTDYLLQSPQLIFAITRLAPFIAAGFLGLFFWLLFMPKLLKTSPRNLVKKYIKNIANSLSHNSNKLILIIIFLTFFVRLYRLGIPTSYHFDEVYHAFTAQEMLKGNVMAWQWWNTPPKGVAYEWTHPPLAKHFMVTGMLVFGNSPFGWRFPSVIFGTANVLLIYLLAKQLFLSFRKSYSIPLLAAGLYSLESLSFVQSRIGMNDTYMIFFILLSLFTLLKKKYPASALSFALALTTKWSAIYLAPVLAVSYFLSHKKIKFKSLTLLAIGYPLATIIIYLFSYLPFFTSGHTWSQFIELQKQMYWYHTNLEATHNYSSPWWTWPLLLRPVWYHVDYGAQYSIQDSATSAKAFGLGNGWISSLLKAVNATADQDNAIANIYALGNPIIFWGGLTAIIYSVLQILKMLYKKSLLIASYSLLILLSGYLAFLLPWAIAPRIMFLYHYLPSIPFMVIILAWCQIKLYNSSRSGRFAAISYTLLAISVFFFFYPHLTAIPIPKDWVNIFFWFPSWK